MATFYVRKTGSNNNPGTSSLPKLTIEAGIGLLSSGDTLIVGDGTYNDHIPDNVPSGLGPDQHTTIRSENLHGAIFQNVGNVGFCDGVGYICFGHFKSRFYVTFDGFIVDGTFVQQATYGIYVKAFHNQGFDVHDIHILNCEIRNFTDDGDLVSDVKSVGFVPGFDVRNLLVSHCVVHDVGIGAVAGQAFYGYGFYWTCANSILEYTEVYNIYRSYGVHSYNSFSGADNNIFRNLNIHDCGGTGLLLPSGGANTLCYNNLIYNNGQQPGGNTGDSGIRVAAAGTTSINTRIYNNTIYHNGGRCISLDDGAIGAIVQNNIIFANGNDNVFGGQGTVSNNNLPIGVDPLFVSASTGNFNLRTNSPARDVGLDLSSIFTTDYTGGTRTSPWDYGALDAGATAPIGTPRIWYNMEEGIGSLVADQTGSGNPATLFANSSGVLPTWVQGRLGNYALHFTGAGEYAQQSSNFNTGNLTLVFTLKADNAIVGGSNTIPILLLYSDPLGSDIGLNWDIPDVAQRQAWIIGSQGVYTACKYVSALSANTFYRLGLTWDGSTMRAYLNGVLETSVASNSPVGMAVSLTMSWLGQWAGTIDEVRLENTCFTSDEMMSDFIRSFNPPIPSPGMMRLPLRPMLVR